MSTGLGVIMWAAGLPNGGGATMQDGFTPGTPYSNCLLYGPVDRPHVITHVMLSNVHTATRLIRFAITLGGAPTAVNDASRVMSFSFAAGQIESFATRIPIKTGYGLIGMTDGALGDWMVYAGITGEVVD